MARPGAVSRAHRGVLFLDECAEIGASVLEALRTPLEDGEIRLARRDGVARYPARFQLILAANPCPCAPADPRDCMCAAVVKRRYLGKLSGPLLDRVDLRVQLHPIRSSAFAAGEGEATATVRDRVAAARDAAAARWAPHGIRTNAEVSGRSSATAVSSRARRDGAVAHGTGPRPLSIRGVDRTLRVAWTLSDLAGRTSPGLERDHHRTELSSGGGAHERRRAPRMGVPVPGRRAAVCRTGGVGRRRGCPRGGRSGPARCSRCAICSG